MKSYFSVSGDPTTRLVRIQKAKFFLISDWSLIWFAPGHWTILSGMYVTDGMQNRSTWPGLSELVGVK